MAHLGCIICTAWLLNLKPVGEEIFDAHFVFAWIIVFLQLVLVRTAYQPHVQVLPYCNENLSLFSNHGVVLSTEFQFNMTKNVKISSFGLFANFGISL